MDKQLRRFARVDVNLDPLFPGRFQGVWIGEVLPTPPTPAPTPTPYAFQLVPEMPAPPRDPEQEKKWQTAVQIADHVVDRLGQDDDFDPTLLYKVVKDMVEGKFDPDDIVAIYHHRKHKGEADG